jgi:acetylornithine deacetylase/succinyl-diaminopimelate desuccinylase-like protein
VGITEWGQQGNPVVYAKCDEGAEKTLVVYWMYDTMPVTQPDLWKAPPFEGRLVEQAPVSEGADRPRRDQLQGGQMAFWNAMMSIKAVTGKLPVNLIFVAEGDEERMSIGYRKFVRENPQLFDRRRRHVGGGGGSEGCVFVELITSGSKWGRGPNYSDIHGGNKRSVDAPGLAPHQDAVDAGGRNRQQGHDRRLLRRHRATDRRKKALLERQMPRHLNLKAAAQRLGVERYISDDPLTHLKMARYGTSMNLDGIWGGNMFPGGSGAILPNRIVSKHNFRYIPNMTGPDIVDKLRKHLDKHGYQDVEINVVGDVPWAKVDRDNDVTRAFSTAMEAFGRQPRDVLPFESIMGGYWPAYLFRGDVLNIPIASGSVGGGGGNAHAANEYIVIEGAGTTYGYAANEKSIATSLFTWAGLNEPK